MSIFIKSYKEYIVTVGIACGAGALVWFGIVPLHKTIADQMNRSQEILVNHAIRDTLVASLSDVREQKSTAEAQEDRLGSVIAEENIVDVVKAMEDLAKETDNAIIIDAKETKIPANTKAKVLKKDSKETEKTLLESLPSDKRLSIAITVIGSYGTIVEFVRKLEAMPYETDVVGVALSVRTAAEKSGQPAANLFSPNMPSSEIPPTETIPVPASEDFPVQAVLDTVVYIRNN